MRKALVLALMCAAALAACNKDGEGDTSGPAPGAQPLLAGPDEGAKPGEPGYVEGFSKGGQTPSADAGATSPAGGATATPGGGRTGAAPARPIPAAADGSKPMRKAGLWQLTTSSTGGPPPGMGRPGGGAPGAGRPGGGPGAGAPGGAGRPGGGGRGPGGQNGPVCVTAASEAERGPINAPRGDCTSKLSKSGSGWTLTSTCTREMQGNRLVTTSTATLTGDLNSKYTVKTVSKTTGMPAEMAAMGAARTTTTTGTYKGATCPAG